MSPIQRHRGQKGQILICLWSNPRFEPEHPQPKIELYSDEAGSTVPPRPLIELPALIPSRWRVQHITGALGHSRPQMDRNTCRTKSVPLKWCWTAIYILCIYVEKICLKSYKCKADDRLVFRTQRKLLFDFARCINCLAIKNALRPFPAWPISVRLTTVSPKQPKGYVQVFSVGLCRSSRTCWR